MRDVDVAEPYDVQAVLEDGVILPCDMAKAEHLKTLPSISVENVATDGWQLSGLPIRMMCLPPYGLYLSFLDGAMSL